MPRIEKLTEFFAQSSKHFRNVNEHLAGVTERKPENGNAVKGRWYVAELSPCTATRQRHYRLGLYTDRR